MYECYVSTAVSLHDVYRDRTGWIKACPCRFPMDDGDGIGTARISLPTLSIQHLIGAKVDPLHRSNNNRCTIAVLLWPGPQ
jgi:hypothetical protein